MAKKEKKKKEKTELDIETTFADMNVEGFDWYDPAKKNGKKSVGKVSRKEYWAMVRGAFRAMWPMFACIVAGALFMVLLAFLWLK